MNMMPTSEISEILSSQTVIVTENGGSSGSSKKEEAEAVSSAGETTKTITFMDSNLFKAASVGRVDILDGEKDRLHLILTPTKNTVLHICIASQSIDSSNLFYSVKIILDMCPSLVLQVNTKGETPLHIAARYGIFEISVLLIQNASDFEAAREMVRMTTNKEKDTALHEAVRHNHLPVVQLLTREDPDFACPTNDAGETPLYLAAERGFTTLVTTILRNCTSPTFQGPKGRTALHAAVISNNQGMTTEILKVKSELTNKEDGRGWTPLHYATYLGYVSMVKQLLASSDKSAAYFQDGNNKRTPLHIAALRGHGDIVNELMSRSPDCCEIVDKSGQNVLHFAVMSRNSKIVQVVLENSFNDNLINEKDTRGNTPLHQLCASVCCAPTLIEHPRADKMALNNDNLSPLDIILANEKLRSGKVQIVRDLKKAGAKANWQNVTIKDDGASASTGDEKKKDFITELKKAQETHLIVATLIATITFAAGLTLPGGYIQDLGPDQGTANLAKKTAFKAFVITNTLAMVLASSSVFLHLFLAVQHKRPRFFEHFILAFFLTICAMGAMVVAFMTGLYAVLEHSLGLAISTCVIACIFFLFYFNHFKISSQNPSVRISLWYNVKSGMSRRVKIPVTMDLNLGMGFSMSKTPSTEPRIPLSKTPSAETSIPIRSSNVTSSVSWGD